MILNKALLYSFLRFLFIAVSIIAGGIILYFLSTITYPFIIAIVISLIINPIVNFFEKKLKFPRGIAVFISLIIILIIIAGLFSLLIVEIIAGLNYLSGHFPEHFKNLVLYIEQFFFMQIIPIYNQIASLINDLNTGQQTTIMNNFEKIGTDLAANVGEIFENVLKGLKNILSLLPNAATTLIFSLLATFFISKDWEKLKSYGIKLLPEKVKSSGGKVFIALKKALFGFIRAQLTLISITSLIVLVGLLILRVDYAITIAVIIGLVDLLPYLGTGLVFVPWIIYNIFTNEISMAIGLSILYIVVIVQRQFMEPKVLSSSIGLDPLATLVSLFVGYKLFGFLGLIIGPVVLVIIKTLHQADIFRDLWSFIIGKKH